MVAGLQRHTRKDKVAGKLLGFLCLPCCVCVIVGQYARATSRSTYPDPWSHLRLTHGPWMSNDTGNRDEATRGSAPEGCRSKSRSNRRGSFLSGSSQGEARAMDFVEFHPLCQEAFSEGGAAVDSVRHTRLAPAAQTEGSDVVTKSCLVINISAGFV